MNASEENKRGANELNDEELEEISGGKATTYLCLCLRCHRHTKALSGTPCPFCKEEGVNYPLMKA